MSTIFYSINDGEPIKYNEKIDLELETGTYTIKAFGKDKYNRPTLTEEKTFSVDTEPPLTKLHMIIEPDGLRISFHRKHLARIETYFTVYTEETKKDLEWIGTDVPRFIPLPWINLNINPNLTATIIYYSLNEFGKIEIPRPSLKFSLGNIPTLMWGDTSDYLTPQVIWRELIKDDKFILENFKITLISNNPREIEATSPIPDDTKGVKFESDLYTFDVMFSEKYSLYFSGPPTEVLELNQVYNFSFELLTSRSGENVTSTSPKARLHSTSNRKLKDQFLPLKEKNGIFYGSFKVDKLFLENKFKLIITDTKNKNPALREIPLAMKKNNR